MHLVIGASGFLGRNLLRHLGSQGLGTFASHAFAGGIPFDATHERFDHLAKRLPAGITHVHLLHGIVNPDLCFKEPDRARAVNVTGMIALLSAILERGMTPIFMSTDYVYDGTRGSRTEDEPTTPTTSYGRHKAEVEAWLCGQARPFLICRSSKIVSEDRGIHSVIGQWADEIKAGKALRCAEDQIFSPGHVRDIAGAIVALADKGATGIFHTAGPRAISRYALAELLLAEIAAVSPETRIALEPCRLADIPFLEPRPLNTSLSVGKLVRATGTQFASMQSVCRAVAQRDFAGEPAVGHRRSGAHA